MVETALSKAVAERDLCARRGSTAAAPVWPREARGFLSRMIGEQQGHGSLEGPGSFRPHVYEDRRFMVGVLSGRNSRWGQPPRIAVLAGRGIEGWGRTSEKAKAGKTGLYLFRENDYFTRLWGDLRIQGLRSSTPGRYTPLGG